MKLQSKPGFKGGNSVFLMNHAPYSPLTPMALYKNFKRFIENDCPELPNYRLHDLRHPYVKPTTKKFTTFFEDFRAAA